MVNTRPLNPAPFALLFLVGFSTFARFAPHVRTVEAVGLTGAGFALGVAFFGVIMARRDRRRARASD